ncbi:MAG: helix-turn-helix domain-containing protein, partial [Spirochaetales bacterium]|nr:helix-turn-helix domain-containing protein [Spirochaetales bacterium]
MTVNDKIISTKLGLLNLAEELGNVSKACKVMGFSRDTFYRYKEAMETGGVEALLDSSRRVPNHKNRVDERTETAAVALAIDNPALGQVRVSNELRKAGVFVSPGGVRSIWLRHGLETMKKRLLALTESTGSLQRRSTEVDQVTDAQRASLDQVVTAVTEINHAVHNIAQNAQISADQTRDGREQAEQGVQLIDRTVNQTDRLAGSL